MALFVGTAIAVGATAGAVSGIFGKDSPWREVGSNLQEHSLSTGSAVGTMTEGAIKGGAGMVSTPSIRRGPIQGPGVPRTSRFGSRTNMGAQQPVSGSTTLGLYNRRRG